MRMFCTIKGLEDLMNTGVISEVPSEAADPLPPAYRKEYLKKIMEHVQHTPSFKLSVFRPEILYDMTWRSFYLHGQKGLLIKLYDTLNYIEIKEKGIVDIFNYYFEYLITHPNNFLSREELIEYLQNLLTKYFPE
jgi:hypothetical protein